MSNLKRIIVALMFFLPVLCYANALGQIFDDIVRMVGSTSRNWLTPMQQMAIQIFSIFFLPETIWMILKKYLEGDIGRAYSLFFIRMITGGFYFYWITHPEIFFGIVQYFATAGAKASGFTISTTGDFSVKPSDVMNYFGNVSDAIGGQLGEINGIRDGITILFSGFEILIVLLCLIVIALMLTVTELETYVVCCGGIGLAGFAGSSWTMGYFQSYLRFVVAVGVKMMFMCLVLGMLGSHIEHFSSAMSICANPRVCSLGRFTNELTVGVIDCIVLTYLSYHIPNLASSLLSGNLNMNYAGLLGAAGAIGAAAAAPVAAGSSAVKAGASINGAAGALIKGLGRSGGGASGGPSGGSGSGGAANDGTSPGVTPQSSGSASGAMNNSNQSVSSSTIGAAGGSGGVSSSDAPGRLQNAGNKTKAAGGHMRNAFGHMANMAQKSAPKGGGVESGRGPDIGH